MSLYLSFISGPTVFRVFFAFAMIVDLACVYAAIFDRDLLRRIAVRFFSSVSGQTIRIDPSPRQQASNWVVFALISAVPPVAWIAFELYFVQFVR